MKTKLIILFLLFGICGHAQCIEGDCKEGFGRLIMHNYMYIGFFKDGKYHGIGKIEYDDKSVFKGAFLNGLKNGNGIMTNPNTNETVYGQFKDGQPHGYLFLLKDGKVIDAAEYENGNEKKQYAGQYLVGATNENCKGNCRKGFGLKAWGENNYYIGFWFSGNLNEIGIRVFEGGDVYKGGFKDDKFDGFGEYVWKDGTYYTGEWKNNKRDGYGVRVSADGSKEELGLWKRDSFVQPL